MLEQSTETVSGRLHAARMAGHIFNLGGYLSSEAIVALIDVNRKNKHGIYKLICISHNFNRYSNDDPEESLLNAGYKWSNPHKAYVDRDGNVPPTFNSLYQRVQPKVTAYSFDPNVVGGVRKHDLTPKPVNAAMDKVIDNVLASKKDLTQPTRDNKGRFDGVILPPRGKNGRFLRCRDVAYFDYAKQGVLTKRRVALDYRQEDPVHYRGFDFLRNGYRCFRKSNVSNFRVEKEYVEIPNTN